MPLASYKSKASSETINIIFDLYSHGLSHYKIGKKVGLSAATVGNILNPNLVENRKSQRKKYREENKLKIVEYKKQYYEENKEYFLARSNQRYQDKREEIIQSVLLYYQNNKEKNNAYHREYRKLKLISNPELKLVRSQRTRINYALKNISKIDKTLNLLGCSSNFLKQYIESKFIEGMSWDNYGYYGWHVDHIKACSTFDLTDPEQQKICFHYTNLQPMWAFDNMSWGAKDKFSLK